MSLPPTGSDLDLVEAAYRCAADASAYDELLTAWAARLDSLTSPETGLASAEVADRMTRAANLLSGLSEAGRDSNPFDDAAQSVTAPALVIASKGAILALNPAAQARFGVARGTVLPDTVIEPSSRADFDAVRRSIEIGGNINHALVRVVDAEGATELAECFVVGPPAGTRGIAIRLLETSWPSELQPVLASAFSLTDAECEICRLLLEHRDTALIAELRATSVLTVRTQLRTIFGKTGAASQVDLVRMLSLLATRFEREKTPGLAGWRDPLRRERVFRDAAGLSIGWTWMGARDGRPAILVHAAATGYMLPGQIQSALADAGVTLYAVSRPFYGRSDGQPRFDAATGASHVIGALADHLGLDRFAGIGISSGLIPLIHHASEHPDRITSLLGIGGCLPLSDPASLKALPAAQRTMLHLARYAPALLRVMAAFGIRAIRQNGAEWYLRRVYAECPPDVATLDDPQAIATLRSAADFMVQNGPEGFISEFSLLAWPWEALLEKPLPSIRMLHGSMDSNYRAEKMAALAAKHKSIELTLVDGAGELLAFQHPELVADAIIAMIGR
ncbi:MAG TPA: alpha/beta fold hydrolase [Hyphomonas sp.]|nr:alpha/beta fold hydrolase [Hyphomonas sp.]